MEEEESGGDGGAPAWMATFADMMSLLLTFFVLLLSFANMDVVKFQEMLGSVKEAFGYQKSHFGNYNPQMMKADPDESATDIKEIDDKPLNSPGKHDLKLLEAVEKLIQEKALQDTMKVAASHRGVVVRVTDKLMFSGGGSKLLPESARVLDEIVQLVDYFPYHLLIEGHTDNQQIRSPKFPSNWELSTARATSVMRYLVDVGGIDPRRLGVAGYAGTRPVVPNDTEENRIKNRRVEFICYRPVLQDDYWERKAKKEAEAQEAAELAEANAQVLDAETELPAVTVDGEVFGEGKDAVEEDPDAMFAVPDESGRVGKRKGNGKGKGKGKGKGRRGKRGRRGAKGRVGKSR